MQSVKNIEKRRKNSHSIISPVRIPKKIIYLIQKIIFLSSNSGEKSVLLKNLPKTFIAFTILLYLEQGRCKLKHIRSWKDCLR